MGNKLGVLFEKQQIYPSEYLQNKTVVIDGNLWIYKYCAAFRDSQGNLFSNPSNKMVTAHIYGMLKILITLKKITKKIIFVIERGGKLNDLKRATLAKRKEIKSRSIAAYQLIKQTNVEVEDKTLKKLKTQSFSITPDLFESTEKFLRLLGITYYETPNEGELECARLVKLNVADVCLTDDWDVLLYDIPFLRNVRLDDAVLKADYIDVKSNLERLNITHGQLVEMCLLTGNDYFSGIPKIGPLTALKLLQKYHTLTNLFENESKYDFTELKEIYLKILTYLSIDDNTIPELPEVELDSLNLKNFLRVDCGFTINTVLRYLKDLE